MQIMFWFVDQKKTHNIDGVPEHVPSPSSGDVFSADQHANVIHMPSGVSNASPADQYSNGTSMDSSGASSKPFPMARLPTPDQLYGTYTKRPSSPGGGLRQAIRRSPQVAPDTPPAIKKTSRGVVKLPPIWDVNMIRKILLIPIMHPCFAVLHQQCNPSMASA